MEKYEKISQKSKFADTNGYIKTFLSYENNKDKNKIYVLVACSGDFMNYEEKNIAASDNFEKILNFGIKTVDKEVEICEKEKSICACEIKNFYIDTLSKI